MKDIGETFEEWWLANVNDVDFSKLSRCELAREGFARGVRHGRERARMEQDRQILKEIARPYTVNNE